jgi:ABC-2 type transport system ATP-binding protein
MGATPSRRQDEVTMTADAAITVRGLVKVYGGGARALDGLDLEVATGTVLGLLGPNGSGKTTAVRILATILRPDAGRVLVGGHDPVEDPAAVRAMIGLAGQYAAVDDNLTGRENLRLVGRLAHMGWKELRERTVELLEHFDLAEAADRLVRTYSGGMRRRLDLAAALVHRPPILFLDEPTTGLDPRSRNGLWAVIRELVGGGTSVLLTTQYLEEADALAGQIVVMDAGRAIATGTAQQLKAGLAATIAIELRHHGEAVRAAQLLAASADRQPQVDGPRVEFGAIQGRERLVHALRQLDRHGLEPTGVALREPSLDEVFLNLTGHRATDPTDRAARDRAGQDRAQEAGVS